MKKSVFPFVPICFILLIACLLTVSCEKKSIDNDAPATGVLYKLDMLTAEVYIYDSVFTNWGTQNTTLVYARTAIVNQQNWANERVKFYRDGTFDEIMTNGVWRQGYWSMNNDSTVLFTSGAGYSNSAKIELLNTNKLVWVSGTLRGVQIVRR